MPNYLVQPKFFTQDFNAIPVRQYPPVSAIDETEVATTLGLLQADADFAYRHGGDFVRQVLQTLPAQEFPLLVDTKIHMLKPGWYPGIPGWHLDFAPGWTEVVGFDEIDPRERHFMALSHGHSLTQFAIGPIPLTVPENARRLNGLLSKQLDALDSFVEKFQVEPLRVYEFGQTDLHRVMPAVSSGWRMFVRVSATKLREPLNQVRANASQVYLLDEHLGW